MKKGENMRIKREKCVGMRNELEIMVRGQRNRRQNMEKRMEKLLRAFFID